jgi:hypothetical protein
MKLCHYVEINTTASIGLSTWFKKSGWRVAISEQLDIAAIATLDSDFDIYRCYRKQPFQRIFVPQ